MCSLISPSYCDFEQPESESYSIICKTLQDDVCDFIKHARKSQFKPDVFLLAFDDNLDSRRISLSAHKEILAAASPYLAELLGTSNDCDIYLSFSDFKQSELELLLDYIYTGEIHASRGLMEEFELCLKELGILGTHSLVCTEEIAPFKPTEMPPIQSASSIQDPTQSNTSAQETVCESNIPLVESTQNITCGSSDSESEVQEEESEKLSTDDRPYVCPVCQKSFRHLNVLRTHSRVHTGEKPFTCGTCNRSFSHKSTLSEHMNLHSDDRPYECSKCQRRFKQRKGLRAHRCENLQEEVFQCEVCGRHFINRKALALHRIHHEAGNKNKPPQEKSFLCDVCARGFSNKYLLKAHQMTHNEEKRYECDVCHKKFALKKTLQVHETSHKTDKGPYKCSYCPKSFRYVANLNTHELIHSGKKPFDCTVCGCAFRQKWSLKEHMLTHDKPEENPFTCEVCNKSFQTRRPFIAHRYSHNKQTKRCPVCKKRFYNAERLAQHMKDHETVDDDLPEEIGNSVTAHMNEAGELIITQHDVDDNNERALIFTPSLLHMIQSADETADPMTGHEGQDEGNRWSLEVVIDS